MTAQILRDEPDHPASSARFLRSLAAYFNGRTDGFASQYPAQQLRKAADEYEAMLAALREIARIGAIPDQDVEHRRLKRDEMWNIACAAIRKAEGQ
jgi:hypothetical protein